MRPMLTFQLVGERRGAVRFERHSIGADVHDRIFVGVIYFELSVKPGFAHPAPWIVEAHKGGDRHLRRTGNPLVGGTLLHRLDPRRERRADPGLAVAVTQSTHLQIGERHELCQTIAAVAVSLLVGLKIQRPERKLDLSRTEIDFAAVVRR